MAEHEAIAELGETSGEAGVQPITPAAAMALGLRKGRARDKADPMLDAFLLEQTDLVRIQKEHMHEQRELQLSRLRWGRFSDRMRAGLQAMTVVVGLAAAGVVAAAVVEALRSDSVVVDAFHAPPALAAQGLDGTVVASGVLDELARLQTATRTSRTKRGVRDAWSGDVRLEVPETGVSIGELRRYLHALLGRETHIGGDLVQAKEGLVLTVRGDSVSARSFAGTDLKALSVQAAEYIYGGAEPYAFSTFLLSHGRTAESVEFAKTAYPNASPQERPWLLVQWGNGLSDLGQYRASLDKHEQAMRLKPDLWIAWADVVNDHWVLADQEDALRTSQEFERLSHRGAATNKVPPWFYENGDILRQDWTAFRAEMVKDAQLTSGGSQLTQAAPSLALTAAMMHDPRQAEEDLETARDAANDPVTVALAHFVRGRAALDRGDPAGAATELEPMGAAFASPALWTEFPGLNCWLAPAEELAGHPDKADAAVKAGGRFVDCYRFRADILDHRGDWPGAQTAYASAVALAPDMPAAYYSWGLALARHGDLAGAMAKYALANGKGPHWADPLKAWGDALAAQHRPAEAEAKYAAAAAYAPKWTALRIAWGHALQDQGRYREAIAQYRTVTR
jgi:tetratricopeptide (TPR) repeat protein